MMIIIIIIIIIIVIIITYCLLAQIAQARNMSIGELQHSCITFKI